MPLTRFAGRLAIAMLATVLPFTLSHPALAADADNGAKIFKTKCFICHESVAGKNRTGPSLFGVVGRKAGTAAGFKLYRGLKDADWTWDETSIDAYLTDPVKYVKARTGKNPTMVLKIPKQQERDDLIAFLKTLK